MNGQGGQSDLPAIASAKAEAYPPLSLWNAKNRAKLLKVLVKRERHDNM